MRATTSTATIAHAKATGMANTITSLIVSIVHACSCIWWPLFTTQRAFSDDSRVSFEAVRVVIKQYPELRAFRNSCARRSCFLVSLLCIFVQFYLFCTLQYNGSVFRVILWFVLRIPSCNHNGYIESRLYRING